jgi:hypothetical protein
MPSARARFTRATATLDGGDPVLVTELHQQNETVEIRSLTATEPDPTWTHTDAAGHFHAWTRDRGLPTLRVTSRHVDCGDPGCACGGEGYDVPEHRCIGCDAIVEPRRRPGPEVSYVPGRMSWSVEVETSAPMASGLMASIVVNTDGMTLFGFVNVGESRFESTGDGVRCWTRLHGASPLGRR